MAISQNGWEANNRSLIESINVPGGRLAVRRGDVATIFAHLAEWYHREVEPLIWPGNWGYAERPIRGGTELSNHASGTAVDFNAPQHPLGTLPTANFSAPQLQTIRQMIQFYEGVLRWGGDYTGRKDGMHWEINANAGAVSHVAAKIRGGAPVPPVPAPPVVDQDVLWIQNRLNYWGFSVAADGILGPKTKEAILAFQRDKGLAADGIVGPQTRGALGSDKVVAPSFPLPRDHYFGLITGPAKSHGGINAFERAHVKLIQQALIRKGYVPGQTNPNSGWADGKFEEPTKQAVIRFQRAQMPGTTRFGEVWWDDWAKLLS